MREEIVAVKLFNKCLGRKTEKQGNTNSALALRLIQEELDELKEAVATKDRVGQLDAFADLLYVVYGGAEFFDLEDSLPEAFDRVHASNMTKFCRDILEVSETMTSYEKQGIEVDYKPVTLKLAGVKTELYVVFRKEDGKCLKSVNYLPVKLDDLV
jgi:predicted HAD superfamily Cof-like phosphohydrolase